MPRVGLLNGVDRQRPDRVDAELIEGFAHRAQVFLRKFERVPTDLITLAPDEGIRAEAVSMDERADFR